MKRMRILAATGGAAALLISVNSLQAEPFLYAAASGQLVKVDVGLGTTTVIGAFNQPGCSAIAISPQGHLFTATHGWPPGGDGRLASVDPLTGNATPFGETLKPENFMGIGFSPDGKLYGVNAGSGTPDAGSLYRFDLETGAASKVNVTGSCGLIMDLAWHPDGTAYGIDPSSLYRIDPNTGEATLVVPTAHTLLMGLAIDDDGNFYISEIVADAPLLRLDPATGATTPVPGVTLQFPHGLEIIPTPRTRPVVLDFAMAEDSTGHWSGSVDMDSDGSPDGTIAYEETSEPRVAGRTTHSEGEITVTTAFYRFTAQLSVMRNDSKESVRGVGAVTEGWLDGARLYLRAERESEGIKGGLRIMPASRD